MLLRDAALQVTGSCFETATCGFGADTFRTLLEPLRWNLGEFTFVALWGFVIGVIWLRTHSVQLVGVVGTALNSMLVAFYEPAREIGFLLLAVSIGIVLYQLVTNRLHHGSST